MVPASGMASRLAVAAFGFFTFLISGGGRCATEEAAVFELLLEVFLEGDESTGSGSEGREAAAGAGDPPDPRPLGPGAAPGMSLVGSSPIGRTALPLPPLPTPDGEAEEAAEAEAAEAGVGVGLEAGDRGAAIGAVFESVVFPTTPGARD